MGKNGVSLNCGHKLRRYRYELELEEQARYIASQLGEEFADFHLELAPRLLGPDELEELIAELRDYGRFLFGELAQQRREE